MSNSTQVEKPKQQEFKNSPRVTFWKPRKTREGSCVQFSFNSQLKAIFIDMAPQTAANSEKEFDFNNKITAKLGLNDVGEILTVLTRRVEGLGNKNDKGYFSGLYHENADGNTIINLSATSDKTSLWFGLSAKRGEDTRKLNCSITFGEAEQLRLFLEKYGSEMF